MKWNHVILTLVLTVTVLSLAGCDKKTDENKPLSEAQAEAEKMNLDQLKSMAMMYKDALVAKKTDIEKVMAKLKETPMNELPSKDAKQLKQEVDNLNSSVKALKERFDIYYNKLREKGGDVSQLNIS